MDSKPKLFLYFLLASLCVFAGCSGSSQTGPIITPKPSSTASASTGSGGAGVSPDLNQSVAFTIDVPAAVTQSSHKKGPSVRRRRATGTTPYISPNVGSVSIQLLAVDGISLAYPPPEPTITDISCATPAAGCQIAVPSVVAAIGTDRYLVSTYTLPGGAPTANNVLISSAVVDVTVNGNGSVNTTLGDPTLLAIGGYVNVLVVTATTTPNPLVIGSTGTGTILVTALDVAGATIIGNALFANPVTLNANGVLLTGPGLNADGSYTLTQPETNATMIGFTYDGTSSSATVQALTTSASGASISSAIFNFDIVSATPTPTPTTTPTTSPTSTPTPSTSPTQTPSPKPTATVTLAPGQTPSPTPKATATPTATPTHTASPTPTATPTAKPTATPTATPSASTMSLYVLNAGNNTVVEYGLTSAGGVGSARRVLGGSTLGCPSSLTVDSDPDDSLRYGFGVAGMTVDPKVGTVYVSASGDTCMKATGNELYSFAPSATGLTFGTNTLPLLSHDAGADIQLVYDPSVGAIDAQAGVSDTLANGDSYAFLQIAYESTGGVAKVVNAVGTYSSVPCVNSSGFSMTYTGCKNTIFTSSEIDESPYLTPHHAGDGSTNGSGTSPIATNGTGATYLTAGDEPSYFEQGMGSALITMNDSQNSFGPSGTSPGVATSTWIEGLDTLLYPMGGDIASAYDASTGRLYVLESAPPFGGGFWSLIPQSGVPASNNARPDFCTDAAGDDASGAPLCADGNNHYYIVGYNLNNTPLADACPSSACNYPPGAKDLAPVLVIGGDALHLPPIGDFNGAYPFPNNLIPQNGLAAANGKLYLTNPIGATCDTACVSAESNGLAPTAGEIDVYDGTATGYFNDSTPGSVFVAAFKDSNIGVPVAVAVGPSGSATMSPAARTRVEKMHPRNFRTLRHRTLQALKRRFGR